tara:strand:- start:178 stop:414 length:237 start_codon:yes stop_codon:yes gene_type:complete
MFFSAHTAMPFLGFLIFRKIKIRIVFLIITITLAVGVLFCGFHYSVDVVSACFITYAFVIFHTKFIEPLYLKWFYNTQ